MANTIVTTAGNPSGIAATATEIDITSNSEKTGLNDSQFLKAGILCNSPIISINTHTTTQIIPKILDSSANLF